MAGGSNVSQYCGGARPEGAGGERQKQVIYTFFFSIIKVFCFVFLNECRKPLLQGWAVQQALKQSRRRPIFSSRPPA